ncbi:hypothetical protein Trydic_g19547 [Trypoxylus dichotomus]
MLTVRTSDTNAAVKLKDNRVHTIGWLSSRRRKPGKIGKKLTTHNKIKMLILGILLIFSASVNLVSDIVALLMILISKRRTPSYFYITYLFLLCALMQTVSPIFHEFYFPGYYIAFEVRDILNVTFFALLSGIIATLLLIFLLDYFPQLTQYKWVVVGIHFAVMALMVIVDSLLLRYDTIMYVVGLGILLLFFVFKLLFMCRSEIASLEKRKINDDEGRLKHILVLTFFGTKVVACIVCVLENLISIELIGWPTFGYFALAFIQLDPLFFLIVLFKVDDVFRRSIGNFFKMYVWRRPGKVEFENLSHDNGQSLSQEFKIDKFYLNKRISLTYKRSFDTNIKRYQQNTDKLLQAHDTHQRQDDLSGNTTVILRLSEFNFRHRDIVSDPHFQAENADVFLHNIPVSIVRVDANCHGIISTLVLIFFLDYFRQLTGYKWVAVGIHFAVTALMVIVNSVLLGSKTIMYVVVLGILLLFFVFMLLFLCRYEIAYLENRKISDDESPLRYVLMLTFFSTKVVACIVCILENLISIVLTGWPTFGYFALTFTQLYPLFFLIVLFKIDDIFRRCFVDFFKMCACRQPGIVQFQNLPNDSGQLLSQGA